MEIFDKFCPVCKRKNDREAIVCIYCSTLLDSFPMDETGITRTTEVQGSASEKMGELHINEALIPDDSIAMYLAGTSDPVYVSSEKEFVIGRKVEDETADGFLDLAKFGGYQLGLSKRHAMIRHINHKYEVTDLSSRNGTWLNDEHLSPNKPYVIASGSQLRLAKMRLLVLYRPVLSSRQKT